MKLNRPFTMKTVRNLLLCAVALMLVTVEAKGQNSTTLRPESAKLVAQDPPPNPNGIGTVVAPKAMSERRMKIELRDIRIDETDFHQIGVGGWPLSARLTDHFTASGDLTTLSKPQPRIARLVVLVGVSGVSQLRQDLIVARWASEPLKTEAGKTASVEIKTQIKLPVGEYYYQVIASDPNEPHWSFTAKDLWLSPDDPFLPGLTMAVQYGRLKVEPSPAKSSKKPAPNSQKKKSKG